MPEFILDHGTPEASQAFAKLDAFTQGYMEAMFFTECHSDNPELESATVADLAPETMAAIVADCAAFQEKHAALLESVYGVQGKYERAPYDETRAGHDFWFSRNGHGTGYWDRGLGDAGDILHGAAKHSERHLYRGDDGRLYLQ